MVLPCDMTTVSSDTGKKIAVEVSFDSVVRLI